MEKLEKLDSAEVKGIADEGDAESGYVAEFLSAMPAFEAEMIGVCAPSTKAERTRKIRRYARVFAKLMSEGRISTCDPSKLTELDVRVFIDELRTMGLQTSTQARALSALGLYLLCAENYAAVPVARRKLRICTPTKSVHVLSERQVAIAATVLDQLEGWRMAVVSGIFSVALASGMRPGEIIRLHLEDIDISNKTVNVRTPKGNGKFQDPHVVGLLRDDMILRLEKYLSVRERHLSKAGVESEMLFPNLRNRRDYSYSDKSLRASMRKFSAICGFEFSTKTFRSTFCTLILDRDYNLLPTVSFQLSHSNIETTRKFYDACTKSRSREDMGRSYNSLSLPDMTREAESILETAREAGLLKHQCDD